MFLTQITNSLLIIVNISYTKYENGFRFGYYMTNYYKLKIF